MKAVRYAAGTFLALVVAAFPMLALTYSTGAPSGFSGYIEGQNCSVCHSSFSPNSGTGGLTITAPFIYVPGEPVPITVTVTNTTPPSSPGSTRQGFQASVNDAANTTVLLDSLAVDGVTVQRADRAGDARRFATHTPAGTQSTSWTFNWVPPTGLIAPVRVFAAGNAANGDGTPSGDHIYTTSTQIFNGVDAAEDDPARVGLALGPVGPNPARGAARATYTLARAGRIAVRVLDVRGRTVRWLEAGPRAAGVHEVVVETEGLAAGRYVLAVETGAGRQTRLFTVAR